MVLEGRQRGCVALQVWQQTCQQVYLPRLKDSDVFSAPWLRGRQPGVLRAGASKEETRYGFYPSASRPRQLTPCC